jgi:hypothetical protein
LKSIWIFCHKNGMEEWSAFDQCSHFLGKPSGLISELGQPSLPPPLGRTWSPPW